MENECEALPGVAYPGVQDNRSTINTKTGYDDEETVSSSAECTIVIVHNTQMWPTEGKGGRDKKDWPAVFDAAKQML